MLIRHAVKTGIAAAILAGIFQNSDLAHIQYPAMGLIATMLSSNLGDTVKAGWGRLGGSAVGGIFAALLVSTWGINPLIGSLTFIVSSLFCEAFQWKALTNQAGVISALIASEPSLGSEPWQYTFDRVLDNGIGVFVATMVTILFWPDNPRQALQNNLVKVLQNSNQAFQDIVERGLNRESAQTETEAQIAEITEIVHQSESLLEKSLYGIVGKQLAQDNWSDLIAVERRVRRHLWAMSQAFKTDRPSQFMLKLRENLTQLAQQTSITCTALIRSIQGDRPATQALNDLATLKDYQQKITDQISYIRTTKESKIYPLTEIIQVYNFLNILTRFTQELEQLAIRLSSRPKIADTSPRWRFQLNPLPFKQVKHILKTGVALGLTLAIVNFAQLPFGYYAAVALVVAMQPTLGKGIDAGKQRVICTGIGALVTIAIVNTLGGNPFTVGLGIALTILICSYYGFNQGYKPGCFLVAISIMVHGSQPNSYIWGRFSETFLGCVIALIISFLIWSETASQRLDPSISQTFFKLGAFYEMVVSHYFQGLDSREATESLSEEIRQSIRTQNQLQAETHLEPVDDFKASQQQRRWNFFISYEKALFSNILSLQQATGQGDTTGISQFLLEELQELVSETVLAFQNVAAVVEKSEFTQQQLVSLNLSFDKTEQKWEQLRPKRITRQYPVNEAIAFFSVVSAMKEIAENFNQMARD